MGYDATVADVTAIAKPRADTSSPALIKPMRNRALETIFPRHATIHITHITRIIPLLGDIANTRSTVFPILS
jgi:hypothetical protein